MRYRVRQQGRHEVDHLFFDVVRDVFQVIDAVEHLLVMGVLGDVFLGQIEHLANDLDQVVHFELRLLQGHFRGHGGTIAQILELVHFLLATAGHQPGHELHQIVHQRNPQQHVQHVEHGMGHRDMPGDIGTPTVSVQRICRVGHQPFDEIDIEGEHGHENHGAEQIEDRVGAGRAHGGGVGADGGELSRDGGPHVLADDQGNRRVEINHAGGCQGDGDPQHRGTALDDDRQETADRHAGKQAAERLGVKQVQIGNEIGVGAQRRKRPAHEFQTGENQTQCNQGLTDGAGPGGLACHHGVDAQTNQQQAVLAHLDR